MIRSRFPLRPAVLALALVAASAATSSAIAADTVPAGMPGYGKERPLAVPDIKRRTLANGLQVWVVPTAGVPKVTMTLAVRGGTAADAAATPALSSLMMGMLNEGTTTRNSKQIAEGLQAIGGDYSAAASADGLSVACSALASRVSELVELCADTILHPAFPDKEVALQQANATQGLKAREAQPDFQAGKAFADAVYGDHPYARAWTTAATVAADTSANLRALYAARMRPDQALLVIAGKVDAERAFRLAEQAFAGWKAPSGAAAAQPRAPMAGAPKRVLVERAGAVQSNIRYGRLGVSMRDPDYIPLALANTMLGGGFDSRIIHVIREEKGYSYSPGSSISARALGGTLVASVEARNEVTGATLEELDKIYAGMGDQPPSAREMSSAKRLTAGLYLIRNQMQGALAGTMASYWLLGLPDGFFGSYVGDSNRVTAEQVQAVSRKYLDPKSQTIVVVGDAKAIDAQLKPHGEFVKPAR